jgi:threonine/homoserine/homoserine lactone efflux protein
MSGPADMLILSCLISLTGALNPGLTLVAAINASMKEGVGGLPMVTLGHMVVEVLIVVVIIGGFSVVLSGYSSVIAGIDGVALVVFGTVTIFGSRQVRIEAAQNMGGSERIIQCRVGDQHRKSLLLDLVVPGSNPG